MYLIPVSHQPLLTARQTAPAVVNITFSVLEDLFGRCISRTSANNVYSIRLCTFPLLLYAFYWFDFRAGSDFALAHTSRFRPPHRTTRKMKLDAELRQAAKSGDILKVHQLLRDGADIHAVDDEQANALHYAARGEDVRIVQLFLKHGAQVDSRTCTARTALMLAAKEGHENIVTVLLDNGADLHAVDVHGHCAMHRAAYFGHDRVVEHLLRRAVNVNADTEHQQGALMVAAWVGDSDTVSDTVSLLLENGADLHAVQYAGWCAMHFAACSGQQNVVEKLLQCGVDVNVRTKNGETSLTLAALRGHSGTVTLLVNHGADVHAVENQKWSAMHCAAFIGQGQVVQHLLRRGVDVDARTRHKETALMITAAEGHESTVSLMLEKGADLHAVDDKGWCATHFAAYNGQNNVVEKLLRGGVDVDVRTENEETALILASLRGHHHTVSFLLEKGADLHAVQYTGWCAMHLAAYYGHESVIQQLLQRCVDVNTRTKLQESALMFAALRGHSHTVSLLLDNGAELHAVQYAGWSAIHFAACSGHDHVIEKLLRRSADVDARTVHKGTALMIAAEEGHNGTVSLLLDNGADVHAVDDKGWCAVHFSAYSGHAHVVEKLLHRSKDVDARTEHKGTALMIAAEEGHIITVIKLLTYGADVHAVDDKQWCAMHCAAISGQNHVIELLLRCGVKVDERTEHEKTALMLAAEEGHANTVSFLLDNGADLQAVDCDGWCAMHFAAAAGHQSVIEQLVQNGAQVDVPTKKRAKKCLQMWSKDGGKVGGTEETALMLAASMGHIEVVNQLLMFDANVHYRCRKGDTALHKAAEKNNLHIAHMLWRAGADPLKMNKQRRTALSLLLADSKLAVDMRIGPPPVAPVNTRVPLSVIQDALYAALQTPSTAAKQCRKLITKKNCSQSLTEWNAAHSLLKLAVADGDVHPIDHNRNLYYWRDQLYCTVSDLHITSEEDKETIFRCLREAQEWGLIDCADAYIHGIHIKQTIENEMSVLRTAGMKLLERLVSVEATVQDLRKSFHDYRQRQWYSNLLAIALKLIPIAGGSLAKVIELSAELCGDITVADVIEYSFSTAVAVLEEQSFSRLSRRRQNEILQVFKEFGYTTGDVRTLLRNRRKGSNLLRGESKGGSTVVETEEIKEDVSTDGEESKHAEIDVPTMHDDEIEQRKGTASCVREHESRSASDDAEIDLLQCEHEHTRRPTCERESSCEVMEFAGKWRDFTLGTNKLNDEEVHTQLKDCLIDFLMNENVSPESLRSGSPSVVQLLVDGANTAVKTALGTHMRLGYTFKLRQFLQQFVLWNEDGANL